MRFAIVGALAGAAFTAVVMGTLVSRSDEMKKSFAAENSALVAERATLKSGESREAERRDRVEQSLQSKLSELQTRSADLTAEVEQLKDKLGASAKDLALLEDQLVGTNKLKADAEKVRDTIQAELLASQDRLEKAYKDIADMEKQIVELSKAMNRVNPSPYEPSPQPADPKIDGMVLGVSKEVNLILINVGEKDKVKVGMKFTIYRGSKYVSKVVVDRVDDNWAACRELTEFRKETIEQGDQATTRLFD